MPLPRVIAVDGPAGSGKSSVSFAVARDLGYLFIDTGAFYRALTLAAIEADCTDAPEYEIEALAQRIQIDITADLKTDGRQYTALLNGRDVTWAIRTPEVEAHVSRLSAFPSARAVINAQQKMIAARGNVIMVGRDIGTVVLPDANLKLYLDASSDARALRRYQQSIADGQLADLEEIKQNLEARDTYDSKRETAPLKQAADAVYLNTDDLSFAEVIARVKQIITHWQASV